MFDKLSRQVLHPFFTAAYPILFLLSVNMGQTLIQQAGRILAVCMFIALILTLGLGMVTKNFQRGGVLASLLLALFFFYGHAYNWLEKNASFGANHTSLNFVWGILLLSGVWAIHKTRNLKTVTKYLNLILLFLVLQPAANIGLFVHRYGFQLDTADQPSRLEFSDGGSQPDIYYIILDGYGRSDVLRELYDYDNSSFTNYLRKRGFYIAEQSHSNYGQTALSISSSLNFNYLDLKDVNTQSNDRAQLFGWIRRSKLRNFLRKHGYQTVAFSTGYDLTTLDRSDIFFPMENSSGLNNFEELVLSTSLTGALDPKIQEKWFVNPFRCDQRRRHVLNIFESLEKIPEISGPKFVFAHIISPHPPFVFGSEENETRTNCSMFDGDLYGGEETDYRRGYSAQIDYIDTLTKHAVDVILKKSKVPPIIIIQGDHGPGMLLDWVSPENSCLRERFSILNAYYIPTATKNQLYESITPVNSFRVVLNEVFDLQLPILRDKSYYSSWENPYKIRDVTDDIEASCK